MSTIATESLGDEPGAGHRSLVTGRCAEAIEPPELEWTDAVRERTEPLYQHVSAIMPRDEWPIHAPYVDAIIDLKKKRNAIILAHNYQNVEIFNCVADVVGDSFQLAREAATAEADVIVQCGVHFMAETSKLLNPDKLVLIPDPLAGCSLAESITGQDVRKLKAKYPGVPVVTYVNTSAEVKAESDICCTSSNALKVVESLGVPRVIFLPDTFLADYVASQTDIEVISWHGRCEVHERFSAGDLRDLREVKPGIVILAHPECSSGVLDEADYSGSTAQMSAWIRDNRPARAALITECSMASNVALESPGTEFSQPCHLCPHMQRITLPKILQSLVTLEHSVEIDHAIAGPARTSVQRMVDLQI